MSYWLYTWPLAAWVLYDSYQRRDKWIGWPVIALLTGPLVLPPYLVNRNLLDGEVREGGTAWNLIRYFALTWTALLGAFSLYMVWETASLQSLLESETVVGTTLGIGLSYGVIFVVWFIPTVTSVLSDCF